jgi:Lar family restriction alleviation protein
MSKDVDSASALSERPTEYERGWRDAQEKCAKICDEHATNALIAADAEISGGPVEDSWLSTARAHQRSAAAIRGLAWDALLTARSENEQISALQSRLERAEQDAKRYRWLRENSKFYERIDRDEIDAIHSMALAYLRTAQQGDEGHSDNALSERSTEHPEVAALLKPCPFCGSVAYIHQGHAFGGVFYSVSCVREGCLSCSGPVGRMEDEQAVIDTWNRRAADVNSRDALKTASQADKKEGAGEQQSDASEPDLDAEGQIAELSYAALRERDRADALQSRLESLTAELEEARLIAREQNDAHVTANMRAAEAESRLERAEQDARRWQLIRTKIRPHMEFEGQPTQYIDGQVIGFGDSPEAAIDQALGSKE